MCRLPVAAGSDVYRIFPTGRLAAEILASTLTVLPNGRGIRDTRMPLVLLQHSSSWASLFRRRSRTGRRCVIPNSTQRGGGQLHRRLYEGPLNQRSGRLTARGHFTARGCF